MAVDPSPVTTVSDAGTAAPSKNAPRSAAAPLSDVWRAATWSTEKDSEDARAVPDALAVTDDVVLAAVAACQEVPPWLPSLRRP